MTPITLPRAVVEQALEALESCSGVPHWPALQPTITALRAALEQPEQGPYCYVYEYDSAFGLHREFYPGPYNGKQKPDRAVPVYANPPRSREWQGLTDTELGMVYAKWNATPGASILDYVRAAEAALKEKNYE